MSYNNMAADFFGGGYNSPDVVPSVGEKAYDFDNDVFSNLLHLGDMTQLIYPDQTYTFLISAGFSFLAKRLMGIMSIPTVYALGANLWDLILIYNGPFPGKSANKVKFPNPPRCCFLASV